MAAFDLDCTRDQKLADSGVQAAIMDDRRLMSYWHATGRLLSWPSVPRRTTHGTTPDQALPARVGARCTVRRRAEPSRDRIRGSNSGRQWPADRTAAAWRHRLRTARRHAGQAGTPDGRSLGHADHRHQEDHGDQARRPADHHRQQHAAVVRALARHLRFRAGHANPIQPQLSGPGQSAGIRIRAGDAGRNSDHHRLDRLPHAVLHAATTEHRGSAGNPRRFQPAVWPGACAVINFVSRRPQPGEPNNAYGEYVAGSDGLFGAYGALEGTQGKWEYRIADYYRTSDGQRENSSSQVSGVDAYIGYRPDDAQHWGLDVHAYQATAGDAGRLGEPQWSRDPDLTVTPYNRNWVDRYSLVLSHEHSFANDWLLEGKLWTGYEDLASRAAGGFRSS